MRAIDPRPSIYMQMGLPVVQAGGRAGGRPASQLVGRPAEFARKWPVASLARPAGPGGRAARSMQIRAQLREKIKMKIGGSASGQN